MATYSFLELLEQAIENSGNVRAKNVYNSGNCYG